MSESQFDNLRIQYVAPDSLSGEDSDPYWLTIEQVKKDDRATQADVADIVDELYDIDPCVASDESTEPAEVEQPTKKKLISIAKDKFDLEECKRRKSGMYVAELRVARSHLSLPYKLVLNIGTIKETVTAQEQVTETVDVKSASFVVLSNPVVSGLTASWLGQVLSASGPVPQPDITAKHNTLSWVGEVTGTIKATYNTTVDIVTVEIPGVPKYEGATTGDPQDSSVLAFYHYQVYQADISPPPEDTGADQPTLAEVCGWEQGNSGTSGDDDEEPLPKPPDPPEYGCIDSGIDVLNHLGEQDFYIDNCCHPGTPNPCMTRKDPNPGGKTLKQGTIDKLTREHDGPIEFIAVGPTGVEGCGAIYTKQVVKKRNCCDEATPITFDAVNSSDILPSGGSTTLFASGGVSPYTWTTSSNETHFQGGRKTISTDSPMVVIYSVSTFCGLTNVSVTDGCSSDSTLIRSDKGKWTSINYTPPEIGPWLKGTYEHYYDGNLLTVYSGKYRATEYQRIQWWGMPTPGYNVVVPNNYNSTSCSGNGYCVPAPPGMTYEDYLIYVYGTQCESSWKPHYYGYPTALNTEDYPELPPYTPGQWDNYGVTNRMAVLEREGNHHFWVAPSGYNSGACGASISHFTWVTGVIGGGATVAEWSC